MRLGLRITSYRYQTDTGGGKPVQALLSPLSLSPPYREGWVGGGELDQIWGALRGHAQPNRWFPLAIRELELLPVPNLSLIHI